MEEDKILHGILLKKAKEAQYTNYEIEQLNLQSEGLFIRYYLEREAIKIVESTNIEEDVLKKIYEENKELYKFAEKVKLDTIFVRDLAKAEEILKDINIENFNELKEKRRKKVEETLIKVGLLESDYEKYPEELSGGQQQRVCIAGAIILSPKLIICDEPIASLDLAIQVQILDLIHKINQEEGISFIFITHNLPAIYRIADRILLLYHGEIQEIQKLEDFFHNTKSEYGQKLLQTLSLIKSF